MSKLIVTSAENGRIKYIEGEEIQVSINDIKNRISQIDKQLLSIGSNLEDEIANIKKEGKDQISKKRAILEEEIKKANDKYASEVNYINSLMNSKIRSAESKYLNSSINKKSLEDEKAKLNKILSSASIKEEKAESAIITDKVISNGSVTRAIVDQRKTVF